MLLCLFFPGDTYFVSRLISGIVVVLLPSGIEVLFFSIRQASLFVLLPVRWFIIVVCRLIPSLQANVFVPVLMKFDT